MLCVHRLAKASRANESPRTAKVGCEVLSYQLTAYWLSSTALIEREDKIRVSTAQDPL